MSTTVRDSPRVDADAAPGPMDPRIRARRAQVRAERAVRRRRLTLGILVALAAVGGAFLVADSPLLAVDEVRVTGTEHLQPAHVRAATGVERGDALAFVDVARVHRAVEDLPWVRSVSVSRRWPDRLVVDVTERTPALWAEARSGAVLVADDGVVVAAVDAPPAGLVEVVGLRRVPRPGEQLRPRSAVDVLGGLPAGLVGQLRAVDVGGELTVHLGSGPAVVLGDADDLAAKGAAAVAVLDHLATGGDRARTVDVRVPRAPTWCCGSRGETTTLPGLDAPVGAPGGVAPVGSRSSSSR